MLTQERFVTIHVLKHQGHSIRAIAKEVGVSRNTVRRYLRDMNAQPIYPQRPPRPTKLAPFESYIKARIDAAKPYWIPATVLLAEIADLGYTGAISQLKAYIRPFKASVNHDPIVRFETEPGQQMQVDFTTIVRGKIKFKAFVATLGYSRSTFVCFSLKERQEDWFAGIEAACQYFGGVPKELLFDNAKAIMIERNAYGAGRHRWNPQLLVLAKTYGFSPKACRPYRAKTKGKVERFNGYLKHSFITPLAATIKQAGLAFDVAVANAHIGPWLETVAQQRIHGTTKQKPQVLLEAERLALMPLPFKAQQTRLPQTGQRPLPIESLQHPLSVYDQLLAEV